MKRARLYWTYNDQDCRDQQEHEIFPQVYSQKRSVPTIVHIGSYIASSVSTIYNKANNGHEIEQEFLSPGAVVQRPRDQSPRLKRGDKGGFEAEIELIWICCNIEVQ
jgi:hypothetical protein